MSEKCSFHGNCESRLANLPDSKTIYSFTNVVFVMFACLPSPYYKRKLMEATPDIRAAPVSLETTLQLLFKCSHHEIPSSKRAAVSVILRLSPNRTTHNVSLTTAAPLPLDILFIQRAVRASDRWSAHIAFPGGHRDLCDNSDLDTAIRETQEELQLDISKSEHYRLVGRLSDRYIPRSATIATSSVLSAFIFLQLPSAVTQIPVPQPSEVSAAFWVSLSFLHGSTPITNELSAPTPNPFLARIIRRVNLQMPAIDVLSLAKEIVWTKGVPPPRSLLWGLTLDCIGDVVQVLGGRRVDWPRIIPGAPWMARTVIYFVDCSWWLRHRFWKRSPEQKRIALD